METDALAALKSLDSNPCSRPPTEHVLPGSIKLTEETLSRLAHLLKSGCSIQLACDEVQIVKLYIKSYFFSLLTCACRLVYPELLFTAGLTEHGPKMHRVYIMSARTS
jgi:hypothetical protein